MIDLQWHRGFALKQAMDDEDILAELLALFRKSATGDLEKIQIAADSDDAEAAGYAAHSIKGAAASLGISRLQELACEMEKAGRDRNIELIRQKIPILQAMINKLAALK